MAFMPVPAKFERKEMKNVGKSLGRWFILERLYERDKDGHALYKAQCLLCGRVKEKIRLANMKRRAETNYCFCGVEYVNWYCKNLRSTLRGMLTRCYDEKSKDYKYYGAKGITVCKQWRECPNTFNDWAKASGYKPGLTIDRIDPKKGYCPENCRWLDRKTNSAIKSTTRTLTYNGITDSVSGWARRLGIPKNTFVVHVRKLTDDEAIEYIKNKFVGE